MQFIEILKYSYVYREYTMYRNIIQDLPANWEIPNKSDRSWAQYRTQVLQHPSLSLVSGSIFTLFRFCRTSLVRIES